MSDNKKKEDLNNAPDMSGAWRVISATLGAFALLVGVVGPASKKAYDNKKKNKDDNAPAP